MKTVLSIYENLSTGGIATVMRLRASAASDLVRHVFYFQNDRGGLPMMRGVPGLTTYVGVRSHQHNIEAIVEEHRPDAVFLFSHYHLASMLRRRCERVYLEYHRSDLASVESLAKFAQHGSRIHVPTEWSRQFILQNAVVPVGTEVQVVPNPVDYSTFAHSNDLSHRLDAPTEFVWVGQFGEHKNSDDALKLFARILRSGLDARLHLVLSREWSKPLVHGLLNQALNLGALERVHVYNDLTPEQMAHLFRRVAGSGGLNLVTSRRESYGLSIAESRACGLASLATNAGAISEHVIDGQSGLLFPFGDLETALGKVLEYAGSHRLRERIHLGIKEQVAREQERFAEFDFLATTSG